MDTTRRGFLTTAVGAASVAVSSNAPTEAAEAPHDHQALPSDMTLRVKSLESLLVEKGLVDPAALDALVDTFEHKVGPRNGARVVAKAWTDPAYKRRLLANADSAIAELGYTGRALAMRERSPKNHHCVDALGSNQIEGARPTHPFGVVGELSAHEGQNVDATLAGGVADPAQDVRLVAVIEAVHGHPNDRCCLAVLQVRTSASGEW